MLPADGWWARYFILARPVENPPTDKTPAGTPALCTLSLVGTATENGATCRWVEMKLSQPSRDKDVAHFIKALIPEKSLLESDQSADRIVRSWSKNNAGRVVAGKIEPNAPGVGVRPMVDAHCIIFPGLRRNFETADQPRTVEYQQGRLTIASALQGKIAGKPWKVAGSELVMISDSEFTLWTDRAVAPGIAAASIRRVTRYSDGHRIVKDLEWTLEDFGTGAKSAIPDHQVTVRPFFP